MSCFLVRYLIFVAFGSSKSKAIVIIAKCLADERLNMVLKLDVARLVSLPVVTELCKLLLYILLAVCVKRNNVNISRNVGSVCIIL